jgi:hypothetical protein
MRNNQIEIVAQFATALEVEMKADAAVVANGISRNYFAADNRVQNIAAFYTALVQALQKATAQGRKDCCEEDVLLPT